MKKITTVLISLLLVYLYSCSHENVHIPEDGDIQENTDSLYCSFKVDGKEMYFNFQCAKGLMSWFDTTVSKDSVLIGLEAEFCKDEDLSPSAQIEFKIFKKFDRHFLFNEQESDGTYHPSSYEIEKILESGEKKFRIDFPDSMSFTEHINVQLIKYTSLEDTSGFFGNSSLYWVDSAKYNTIINPQKDSYFRITSVEIINNNKIARVKAEFSVSIYNYEDGERKILEDGVFCADFWHEFSQD